MKSTIFISLLLSLCWQWGIAQYDAVVFDYELNYFNNGQPLPAESHMLFSGGVALNIDRVEVGVYRSKSSYQQGALYSASWKRVPGSEVETFKVPFHYKLHGNNDYDIQIAFFRVVTLAEKTALRNRIKDAVGTYIDQNVVIHPHEVLLGRNPHQMGTDLNTIVANSLAPYRATNELTFEVFSDVVKGELRSLDAKQSPKTLSVDSSFETTMKNRKEALKRQVISELEPLLQSELLVKVDLRTVRDYPTERMRTAFALNAGYGGVYLGGKAETFTYAESFYLGLSLPLSSRIFSGNILGNTSLSIGAFLKNFKDDMDQEFSGPLLGRPYYIGAGYSLFRFVRFNAGVTVLEELDTSGNGSIDVGAIMLKPFVGISADIHLSIGLRDNR